MIVTMARRLHLRYGWMGVYLVGLSLLLAFGRTALAANPELHNTLPSSQSYDTLPNGQDVSDRPPTDVVGNTTMSLWVDGASLKKVLDSICKNASLNMDVNWTAIQAEGINKDTPVTLHLPNPVPIKTILDFLCKDVSAQNSLGWTTKDGVVIVTSQDDLRSSVYQSIQVYDISDMLVVRDEYPPPRPGDGLFNNGYPQGKTRDDMVREICAIITGVVAPETWRDSGGTLGSMREIDGLLIINQTEPNHIAIRNLLAKIRAMRAGRLNHF